MTLFDSSVLDIAIFIFKVLVALGIVLFIINSFQFLGKVIPEFIGSIFIVIWKGFQLIGFQSSLWNTIPIVAVLVCTLSATLACISSTDDLLWWEFAIPGALIFLLTLGLNIYLKPKVTTQKWHVTPTPKEWPPIATDRQLTPTPKTKIDANKLKKWREYK